MIGFSLSCITNNPIIIGGALLGALLPDIDANRSIISNKIPIQRLTRGYFMKHRGGIHSIYASLIVSAIFAVTIDGHFAVGIWIGYMSHILADSMTYRGVPLWFPFYKRRIKTTNLSANMAFAIISIPCLCLIAIWLNSIGFN